MERLAMKKILALALAAGATLTAALPANAAQGCGPGFHRGYYGRCIPNGFYHDTVVGVPIVGHYYGNRGWWDGHRYYHDRYQFRGGWRYR
jgi:hypothetical protein